MKPLISIFALILLFALSAGHAMAIEPPLAEEQPPERFSLLEIRLGALGAIQNATNYSITGFVNWTPKVRLFDENYLRASLGLFPLRNSNNTNQNFYVIDAQLFVGFPIDSGLLELGGGLQSWGGGNGGNHPVVGGNILWPLGNLGIDLLDHFFLGYTAYFGTPFISHEISMGVGVAF